MSRRASNQNGSDNRTEDAIETQSREKLPVHMASRSLSQESVAHPNPSNWDGLLTS
jgi:hypothetical protein